MIEFNEPGNIEKEGGEIGLLYRASSGDGSPERMGCLPADAAEDTTVEGGGQSMTHW